MWYMYPLKMPSLPQRRNSLRGIIREKIPRSAPENTSVRFLLVKCALKSSQLDKARAGIEFLRKKGWQAEVLGPWEAEIAYLARDWETLATTLQRLDTTGAAPGALQGPLEFWLTPGKA